MKDWTKELTTQRLKLRDIYPERAKTLVEEHPELKEEDVELIRKGYVADKVEVGEEKGAMAVISYISTGTKDRADEVLDPKGVILDNYRENPIVPYAHDYRNFPAGKNMWIRPYKKGLLAKTVFLKHPFAQQVGKLYTEDVAGTGPAMRGWSVGFIPIEWKDRDPEKRDKKEPRRVYTKWELLEYSAVPIPCNPEALTVMAEKGFITSDKLKEDILECVDDVCTLKDIVLKPEETDRYIRLPVKGEEGKHRGHKIRWITVSKKQGIKGIYCIDCKKIITFVFDKKKGWTMEKAKKWMKEHGKEIGDFASRWQENAYIEEMDDADFEALEEQIGFMLEKAKYDCECISCGYKMSSDKHCRELKCPKCGGQMRRSSRPGPGQESVDEEVIELEENEIKSIGGDRNLPINDRTEWDANAAISRMRKLAGGPDKDDINWDKYRRGFVWYDSKDKENFRAYKLPFADVVNGKLTAIWGGVFRAMAALLGARGGVDIGGDKKAAYNFLASYYRRFDKEPPEFREYTEDELEKLFPEVYGTKKVYPQLLEKLENLQNEITELKEGRVLSAKNRKLIEDCITQMNKAVEALNALLKASEKPEPEKGAESASIEDDIEIEREDRENSKKDNEEIHITKEELTQITHKMINDALGELRKSMQREIDKARGIVE